MDLSTSARQDSSSIFASSMVLLPASTIDPAAAAVTTLPNLSRGSANSEDDLNNGESNINPSGMFVYPALKDYIQFSEL